jgi:hypothetical protein
MGIILDTSSMGVDADGNPQGYTVARCSGCPYWNAFAWSREAALRSGAEHERIVHQTRDAERRLNRLLAARTGNL